MNVLSFFFRAILGVEAGSQNLGRGGLFRLINFICLMTFYVGLLGVIFEPFWALSGYFGVGGEVQNFF